MAKKRYCLYLSRPLAHQLERVASLRHGSKSALLEEALPKSLEPEQVPGVEEGLVRRLNELHKALAAIARDVTVATETLALFVRSMLTVTPPIPDGDQEPARLTGRKRVSKSPGPNARKSPSRSKPKRAGSCSPPTSGSGRDWGGGRLRIFSISAAATGSTSSTTPSSTPG